MALSGEGLNEITSQYEHFAQRHIWGMDHVHRTWDDRQVAMSHAISSAVLTPYTQIYGYLGMANPNDTALFTVWRRTYEHFGVLPTYSRPDKAQLDQPSARGRGAAAAGALLPGIPAHAGLRYAVAEHGLVRVSAQRRRRGACSVATRAWPSKCALKGRRRKCSNAASKACRKPGCPARIPGWPAYDAEKIIGLNPDRPYPWSAKPRDLAAPHLAALPAGYLLGRGGVQQGFARFQIARSPAEEAKNTIRLWDYTGSVTGGVRLAGGVVRTFGGLEFEDEETSGDSTP